MRLFSLLLTFYMLVLAIMPCADRVECDKFENQEIVENPNHPDHEHTSEMCSPVCTCNCCGAQLSYAPKTNMSINPNLYYNIDNTPKFVSQPHILNNYLSEIWQPPKNC